MGKDGEILVSVDVENVGEYGGSDVVQLYIRDLIGSRVRPVKELKGYKKLYLEKGEKKTVTITLKAKDLAFTNDLMEKVVEEGEFKLFIGHDSSDSELSTTFFVE
jgi:beta-glucosidase